MASSADENTTKPTVTKRTTKRTTSRSRKKAKTEFEGDNSESLASKSMSERDRSDQESSLEGSEKPKRRTRTIGICCVV